LLRDQVDYLCDRYSERKEQGIQESISDISKTINGVNLSQM
jgi:arsenical resistance protein ArsH